MVSVFTISHLLSFLVMATIPCSQSYNTIVSTAAIYEGVLQPENIIVGIIQNFINFLTSTVGWVLILPFYQVRGDLCHKFYIMFPLGYK